MLKSMHQVVMQIESLLEVGVPPQHITIVGFSKGGAIAIFTSSKLQNPEVNFVIMAICDDRVFEQTDITLSGRILSVYETSDELGSTCQLLIDRSNTVTEFQEIVLETGKRHGTFYTATPDWMEPVQEWANVYE